MIYQFHYDFRHFEKGKEVGGTEFVSQIEVKNGENTYRVLKAELDRLWKTKPPPEGAKWLICNEKSHHFIGTLA